MAELCAFVFVIVPPEEKKTSRSPCEKAIQTPANEGNAICTLHVTVLRMPP